MDTDHSSLKYAEAQLSCKMHISKSERRKATKTSERAEICKCACALINDVGGILTLENVTWKSATQKDWDVYWQPVEEELCKLVKPKPYGDCFDLIGNYDDENIFLFVKKLDDVCFVETNLYLAKDLSKQKAASDTVRREFISKRLKTKVSFPASVQTGFWYGKKIQGYHESKMIQFKAPRKEGVEAIHEIDEHIRKYISAFSNTVGGQIFIGIEDNEVTKGVDCQDQEESITAEIDKIINSMIWGLHPKRGVHWEITFCEVQGCSPNQDSRKVIIISVCDLKGTGGVYVAEPECYKYHVTVTGDRTYQNIPFKEVKSNAKNREEFLKRVPEHLRMKNSSELFITVKGSCQEIKNKYFKIQRGCTVVPKNFELSLPKEGRDVILEIQERCEHDLGVIIAAKSWHNYLGGKAEEGVICDLLLINRAKGMFLFTVAEDDRDLANYNLRVTELLKRKLVAEGGCLKKFFISGYVISCHDNIKTKAFFSLPYYPDDYSVTDANARDKYSLVLQALVLILASYPSLLANRLGIEFLNLLTKQQFDLLWKHALNSCGSRKLWVHGPAGTGKTFIAIALMTYLKKTERLNEDNILYVCENKGLRKAVENLKVAQAVCRETFILGEFPNAKHVIVDEAQNFRAEKQDWFEKVARVARQNDHPLGGYLWVFLDDNQCTHTFPTGLPEPQFQQPSFKLTRVVRNSGEIFKFSKKYVKHNDSLPLEVAHDFEGEKVYEKYEENCADAVSETLQLLKNKGYDDRDIAVLLSTHAEAYDMRMQLRKTGFAFGDEEENDEECIVLTSIRKYSGLERPAIVIVDPKAGHCHSIDGLTYLGVTRASVKLVMLRRKTRA